MSRTKWIVAIALTAVVVMALAVVLRSGWGRPPAEGDRPVVTIADRSISVDRFNQSYVEYLMATGRNDNAQNRYQHLDNLVQQILLAREAHTRQLDSTAAFRAHRARHEKMAAGARYFDRKFAESLPPLTDVQVREAYRKSTEQVMLRHLVFKDRERAEHAIRLLEEGEDFVELANEVFDTPAYDSLAGFLGAAKYWDLDDAVAEAAFALPVGQISGPVRSRYGWHVLRVEDRLRSPLLSESEFQTRRHGIEGRALIRRNRLSADGWVRELMEGMRVETDREGTRLVVDALREILSPGEAEEARPQVLMSSDEIERVRSVLVPGTVLVRYTVDGRAAEFTAADFLSWLPELPYDELRDRPVASIGRALRNEVLGQLGEAAGYGNDPEAREAVTFATEAFLEKQMRENLRLHERVEPTDEEVRSAFTRLGAGVVRSVRADFWVIPFGSFAEADAAKKAIEAGARRPPSYTGFSRTRNEDIPALEVPDFVRKAPLGTPVVHCSSASECRVVQVDGRDETRVTLEEKREEIRNLLARILPAERMTDSLHQVLRVQVDTALFRQMMILR